MAELNVQPKKRKPLWPWLLALLGIIVIIFFLTRGSNKKTVETAAPVTENTTSATAGSTANGTKQMIAWDSINFNAPSASYNEINDKDVTVRAGNGYAIYSVGESILFETGKSTIKKGAEQKLKQISESLGNRFNNGEIMVYGYTDAKGSTGSNKELAEKRADAVKNWLVQNGKVNETNISVRPIGETQPVASNATEAGRQQNRRVDIVVRTAQS